MGKYKGAAEPLTRNEMSKPLRESLDALVDDTYDDLVATIAADRQMKDYKVKTLLDQGLFTAAAAKKAGLIDEVLYADQLQDAIKKALKAEDVDIVTNYKKKRIDTDFSGISGMMKLFELFMGGKPSASGAARSRRSPWSTPSGRSWKARARATCSATSAMGSTTIVAALQEGGRRRQGGGHRAADRQPRRLGHGQRPDLARNGPRQSRSRSSPAWATWPAAAATTSPWAPRRSSPRPAR